LARFINSSVNQSAFNDIRIANALWFTDGPHFRRFARRPVASNRKNGFHPGSSSGQASAENAPEAEPTTAPMRSTGSFDAGSVPIRVLLNRL